MTPLITIFTAPKPFREAHIDLIQRNAIRTWTAFGTDVEIALIGGEEGIDKVASDLGVRHLPAVKTNSEGTPLISSIFELGRSVNESPLLAYVNADILLLQDFLENARILPKIGREIPGSWSALGLGCARIHRRIFGMGRNTASGCSLKWQAASPNG